MKISWIYCSRKRTEEGPEFTITGCDREVVELLQRYLADEAREALDEKRFGDASNYLCMLSDIEEAFKDAETVTFKAEGMELFKDPVIQHIAPLDDNEAVKAKEEATNG